MKNPGEKDTYIKIEFKHVDGSIDQLTVYNTWEYTTDDVLEVFKKALTVGGYPVSSNDSIYLSDDN